MSLMQPGVSNPLAILGRSKTLMDKHFYTAEFLEHKERFEQASQMTLSQYRTAATLILLLEYMAQSSVKTLVTDFVFKIDNICENDESLRSSTECYLALESSTVSDLTKQFQTQTGTEFLNVRYFREKPILSLPNDEFISMDLN